MQQAESVLKTLILLILCFLTLEKDLGASEEIKSFVSLGKSLKTLRNLYMFLYPWKESFTFLQRLIYLPRSTELVLGDFEPSCHLDQVSGTQRASAPV